MGYTHYFTTQGPLDPHLFAVFAVEANSIIKTAMLSGVADLAREYDTPNVLPEANSRWIRFNGVGDEGHETFVLAQDQRGFEFCKTARKPYDTVVTAVLALAKDRLGGAIEISSDGYPEEWEAGVELAATVLGRAIANPIPAEMEA